MDTMLLARRLIIALVLAGFRMWRRLPPEERRLVLTAVRRHGPRVASAFTRRRVR
jgi:hypothetical protein